MFITRSIGKWLAAYLSKPRDISSFRTHRPGQLEVTLQKGDVLLIEGTSRFSTAIKYLTQSNWSHSALYVGDAVKSAGDEPQLVEADIVAGVRAVPLSEYSSLHTRICRPVGLSNVEIDQVIEHALMHIGHQYDTKNIFDLARYLFPTPPVPTRWKRHMLSFGSGDPTRAICSSLIAEAFQSIRYPILPEIQRHEVSGENGEHYFEELLRIRHHSLFVPKDFDVSPYFRIVKPSIEQGFDFHQIQWLSGTSGPG